MRILVYGAGVLGGILQATCTGRELILLGDEAMKEGRTDNAISWITRIGSKE